MTEMKWELRFFEELRKTGMNETQVFISLQRVHQILSRTESEQIESNFNQNSSQNHMKSSHSCINCAQNTISSYNSNNSVQKHYI